MGYINLNKFDTHMMMNGFLWRLCFLAALSVCTVSAQNMRPGRPALPAVALERAQNGEAAVAALAENLPAVARHYGLDAAELRAKFLKDHDLWADSQGQLFYAESHTPDPEAIQEVIQGAEATTAATPAPLDQTFLLHSRAGAPRKIYLDFDGHTTSGTSWKNVYNGSTTVVTPPFDLDGNTSSLSPAELERIQYIWQRVVEDYAPFDVDVTTQDPGVEGLRKTTTSDEAYGIRVCIGGSSTDWYSTSQVGGVAYVGSFDWSSDTPCFVFSTSLGGGEKYVAEALTHEVGHTVDLYHDGTSTSGYYTGHGSGADAWAPVMGVGYYKSVVQFSKGEYQDANNKEDDMAKMTASYNIPYLADDYGNDPANATALAPDTYQVFGRIGRSTDVDFFRFESGGGTFTATVDVDGRSPNLNVELTLLNSSGAVVAVSNPADSLGASLSVTLPVGTYFVKIDGVGTLNPLNTGYSDYGSMGAYRLSGTVPYSSGPLAVASASTTSGSAPLAVQFSSTGSSDADGYLVSYLWTFGDGGSSSAVNPLYTYAVPGTYTATLKVTDNSGLTDADSLTITVLGPPAAPSDLVAAAACNSGDPNYAATSLSWRDNSSNENLFRIQWSYDGSSWSTANEFTTTTSSYTHGFRPFGQTHFYRVRSENASGTSAWTAVAGAATHNVPLATAASAVAVSSSQINLAWNGMPNATGYRTERSRDGVSWTVLANATASTLSYADTGLAGSTLYYYRVSALGACGYVSAPSQVVSAATFSAPLSAPANLSAKANSSRQITLTWSDTTTTESGFYVEVSTGGAWSRVATVPANTIKYYSTGLASRTKYYYRVQAYNASGVSAYSNIASTTTRK